MLSIDGILWHVECNSFQYTEGEEMSEDATMAPGLWNPLSSFKESEVC